MADVNDYELHNAIHDALANQDLVLVGWELVDRQRRPLLSRAPAVREVEIRITARPKGAT